MMNLLADPLLPVRMKDGAVVSCDLPKLLTTYVDDGAADLPFLRRHQESPWHCFLVQLAALALYRAGVTDVPDNPDAWRSLLRALTADHWPEDEPWNLVVNDVSKPAFMQPPVPTEADPHSMLRETPDDLDVLLTSKNHGLKQSLGRDASIAAWIASLTQLQTCGDYSAAGAQGKYFGSIRRNGNYATRPFVGLIPPGGIGAHWRRDVSVLLQQRDWFFEQVEAFKDEGGAALLWCFPWNGEQSLRVDELDPWFIESCRRVRLYQAESGRLIAKTTGSKSPRISAKAHSGSIGDPWIPINLDKTPTAYNHIPHYEVMSQVLFNSDVWDRPLLLECHEGVDAEVMTARFDVLVRGQSKTEGFYRREVPFEKEQHFLLFRTASGRNRLVELSKKMLATIDDLKSQALRPTLYVLLEPDLERGKRPKKATMDWTKSQVAPLTNLIDGVFFSHLFACVEHGDINQAWIEFLKKAGRDIFARAKRTLPITGPRRLKAIATAESKLEGTLNRIFDGYLRPIQEKEVVNG